MTFLSTSCKNSIRSKAILSFLVALLLAVTLLPIVSPFDQEAKAELGNKEEVGQDIDASRVEIIDDESVDEDTKDDELAQEASSLTAPFQEESRSNITEQLLNDVLPMPLEATGEETEPVAPLEAEESFKFQVTTSVRLTVFRLPTGSVLNGNATRKSYNWNIDWGDGTNQSASDSSLWNSTGIPHTYTTAGTYTITITPRNATQGAWLGAFGFSNNNDASINTNANKQMVTAVLGPLTPSMTRTAAQINGGDPPTNEWAYMFYGCSNLLEGPATEGWDDIERVGSSFAANMFNGCSKMTALPDSFNLPQNVQEAGDNFALSMFYSCYGFTELPENFNLPQGLHESGAGFASGMFNRCTRLVSLPSRFNLPQNIQAVGISFASQMFYNCSALASLPDNFNLPPDLIEVGNSFSHQMFFNCSALTELSPEFTFPQGIRTVGNQFAHQMFYNCSGLNNLSDKFTFPQELESVNTQFAYQMLYGAGSADFQINDTFTFPSLSQNTATNAFYETFALHTDAPLQIREAKDIVAECPLPDGVRYTFRGRNTNTSKFSDIPDIHQYWGGYGSESFTLEIETTETNLTFRLPTSGQSGTTCVWFIDWGDGTVQDITASSSSGYAHSYETAGSFHITIRSDLEAWFGAFGFSKTTGNSVNSLANKGMVIAAHGTMTPSMTRTAAQISGEVDASANEWKYMFNDCFNLVKGPSIEGWEGISKVGDGFAEEMFFGCSSLDISLSNFNLPNDITAVGNSFASNLFSGCSNINSLPSDFNLPQGIKSVGDSFAEQMFSGCSSLTSLPSDFNIPQGITSAGTYFASQMFSGCSSLGSPPNDFNLPQELQAVNTHFAYQMFYGAGNASFQINDTFVFPALTANTAANAFYETFALSAETPIQNRPAEDIIADCSLPNSVRQTFRGKDNSVSKFKDIATIHQYWGGYGSQSFTLEVETTEENLTFILPTMGQTNSNSSYVWFVEWGDGKVSDASGTRNNSGVPHSYETAGTFTITIRSDLEAWFALFGFSNATSGLNAPANKAMVTAVHGTLTPSMTRTNAQITAGTAPNYEWAYMFYGCNNLKKGPSIEGWEGISRVGNNFAREMFSGCSNVTEMPVGFSLPSDITVVGTYFANQMFLDCSSLVSLPSNFNFPQNIPSAGTYFASQMFSGCSSLGSLPNDFNLPQELQTVNTQFAYQMFYNAGGAAFQINDSFAFPAVTAITATNAFYETFALSENAALQNRLAEDIVANCPLPNGVRQTFRGKDSSVSKFKDIATIHQYWGGYGRESFTLEVETTDENQKFYLPTSGQSGGTSSYVWFIDWGDGSAQDASGSSGNSSAGIEHEYETAGTYAITISSDLEAWLGAFGFYTNTSGANAIANKELVTEVLGPLTPSMTRTAAQIADTSNPPAGEWSYLFYGCTNLREGPSIEGWEGISRVGNNFARQMFSGCTSLTTLPAHFNLPQDITSVGSYFASQMLSECTNLELLPQYFNLPQGIEATGTYFAHQMFYNAGSSGFQINEKFVFPAIARNNSSNAFFQTFILSDNAPIQNRRATDIIASCPDPTNARQTFRMSGGVSKFKDISFIHEYWGGEGLTEYFQFAVTTTQVNNSFALPTTSMINGNTAKPYDWIIDWGDGQINEYSGSTTTTVTGIPHTYTTIGTYTITIIPQNVDDEAWLAAFGFNSASSNANSPSNKSLVTAVYGPLKPNMTRTNAQIIGNDDPPKEEWACMFYGCTNLKQGPSIEGWQNVTKAGNNFAQSMFFGCTSLENFSGEFNIPQDINSVVYNFAAHMFYDCTSLTELPRGFSLPQNIETLEGDHFAYRMFYGAGSSAFQVNEAFAFPNGTSEGQNNYFEAFVLSEEAPIQQRMASSIIGDCATPNDHRWTFRTETGTSKFEDIADIHEHWGGYRISETFRFQVTTEEADTAFYIPTNSFLNGIAAEKPYDWNIAWGDGETERAKGASKFDSEGIEHIYRNPGEYTITISPQDPTPEAWLGAFGFNNHSAGSSDPANKELVTAVFGPLKPSMTRTNAQIAGSDEPPSEEWTHMFWSCTNITRGPSVEGWEGISKVGNQFASQMFYKCSNLTTLPDDFNLPQDIIEVGDLFAGVMFSECISLDSLPDEFNFPQQITTVGVSFGIRMFYNCSSLDVLPAKFNLPPDIAGGKNNFARQMFYNAGSNNFQINDVFTFPSGISDSENNFLETFVLSEQAPLQTRLASSIIGENENPTDPRWTFRAENGTSKFADISSIHENWGGIPVGLIAVTLELDKRFHKNQLFVVELSNNDDLINRKQLLVSADSDSASFRMVVPPDTYEIKVIGEGSTWRYASNEGDARSIDVIAGTEEPTTVTVEASQISTSWLSDSVFALNRIAESFP